MSAPKAATNGAASGSARSAASDVAEAPARRMARAAGVGNNRATLDNMPTHLEIANRVSTQREAVSKEFAVLRKAGIIHKAAGRPLMVMDVGRLERMVVEVGA